MGKWRRKGQDGSWWTYEGDLVMGKEHGEGVRINQNYSKYEGQFKDGRWHGKGKTTDFQSGIIENGTYWQGILHGDYKVTQPNICIFQGQIARKLTQSLEQYSRDELL